MDRPTRKISAKDLVADIRSGMSDTDIMEKYGMPSDKLATFLTRLVERGLLDRSDLDGRNKRDNRSDSLMLGGAIDTSEEVLQVSPTCTIPVHDFLEDVRSDMSDTHIMEKYLLSPGHLHAVLDELIQSKRLDRSDVDECRARRQRAKKLRNAKWGALICLILLVLLFPLIYGNTASEAGSAFLSIPLIVLCTAFIVFLYRILSDNIRNRYAQGALIVVMAVINLLMVFGYIDLAFRLRIHILFRDARQLMWSPIQCINREQQKLGQPPDGIRECINEQPSALAFDRVTYWRGKDEYVLDVLAWFHGGHLVFRYSSRSGTWEKLRHSKPVSGFVREINYVREGSISFYGRRIWVEAKE